MIGGFPDRGGNHGAAPQHFIGPKLIPRIQISDPVDIVLSDRCIGAFAGVEIHQGTRISGMTKPQDVANFLGGNGYGIDREVSLNCLQSISAGRVFGRHGII